MDKVENTELNKVEKIQFILESARSVSEDKNIKRRERRLARVRIDMLKSKDETIDILYNRILNQGADKVFSKEAYKK